MNARQQAFRVRRDLGLCVDCGKKSKGVNPNTHEFYIRCQVCSDLCTERFLL